MAEAEGGPAITIPDPGAAAAAPVATEAVGPTGPSRHRFGAVPAAEACLVDVAWPQASAREPALQVRGPGAVVVAIQEAPSVRARGKVETDAAEVPAAPAEDVVGPAPGRAVAAVARPTGGPGPRVVLQAAPTAAG